MKKCKNWVQFKKAVDNGDHVRDIVLVDFNPVIEHPDTFGVAEFSLSLAGIVHNIDDNGFQINNFYGSSGLFSVTIKWDNVMKATIDTNHVLVKEKLDRFPTIPNADKSEDVYMLGSKLGVKLKNGVVVYGDLKAVGTKRLILEVPDGRYIIFLLDDIDYVTSYPFNNHDLCVPEGTKLIFMKDIDTLKQQLVVAVPKLNFNDVFPPIVGLLTYTDDRCFEIINMETGVAKSYYKAEFDHLYEL